MTGKGLGQERTKTGKGLGQEKNWTGKGLGQENDHVRKRTMIGKGL